LPRSTFIELYSYYIYLCASMKITIRIFAIYILALSLLPCSDGGRGIVETVMQFVDGEQHDLSVYEQHSNSCDNDSCSTFCICSCCSAALDFPVKTVFKIKTPAPFPSLKPSFVPEIIHSSFSTAVWQPPKFS
jgi:hypothetical protein